MKRRVYAGITLFAVSMVGFSKPVMADDYPSKPIRIIVPFTPGGSNDVLARVVAQRMQQDWKQTVIVENKPGAAGNIGGDTVAKSAPDGYNLLIAPNNIVCMNPVLYSKMPFDPIKDLAPIGLLGTLPITLVINPQVPAKSVKELIALARSSGDGLIYGSSGVGSPQHLSGELFKARTGTKMLHVPYKGANPAITDLMSGQIQVLFSPINSVLPYIKAGKLRVLAVGGSKRAADLPDVPTLEEAGVAGYRSDVWIGFAAPAGTPKDIVNKLNKEINKILSEPEIKKQLALQGIEAGSGSTEEYVAMTKADCSNWAKLIKDNGIRAE